MEFVFNRWKKRKSEIWMMFSISREYWREASSSVKKWSDTRWEYGKPKTIQNSDRNEPTSDKYPPLWSFWRAVRRISYTQSNYKPLVQPNYQVTTSFWLSCKTQDMQNSRRNPGLWSRAWFRKPATQSKEKKEKREESWPR